MGGRRENKKREKRKKSSPTINHLIATNTHCNMRKRTQQCIQRHNKSIVFTVKEACVNSAQINTEHV
jgi:hypothetical protein